MLHQNTPYEQKLLRATEELVTATRLQQIERDHKSIGAFLDTRTIQPLEEVKFQTKRSIKQDIEKRLHGRRGGRIELDISNKATQAVEAFKEQGIDVELLSGNYQLEESIWKDKSSKITYSQRRRFQHPLLHAFYHSMDEKLKSDYKQKISHAFVHLCEKYRKECKELKHEMDLLGIFHPEVNAHRVHCLYLTKLNKGINAANIEDPVLKVMFIEHLKEEKVRGVELSPDQLTYLNERSEKENVKQKKLEEQMFLKFSMNSKKREGEKQKLKPIPSKGKKNAR